MRERERVRERGGGGGRERWTGNGSLGEVREFVNYVWRNL